MLPIVWNLLGFHFIKVPEKGLKFNAACCRAEILSPLSEWRSIETDANVREVILHADNARPHNAKVSTQFFEENRKKPAPRPRYSPDLAPSDFYLFGYIRECRISHLKAQTGFLRQFKLFSRALKTSPVNGLSKLNGPFAEIYRYQQRVYRLTCNKKSSSILSA
jgi:hypothetical protein